MKMSRAKRRVVTHGYIKIGEVTEHVLVAEKALGRRLKWPEQVHHVDNNPANNANANLIICPDGAYHMMLHRRQRAIDACGHIDWYPCRFCKNYDAPNNLSMNQAGKTGAYHKACMSTYRRNLRSRD